MAIDMPVPVEADMQILVPKMPGVKFLRIHDARGSTGIVFFWFRRFISTPLNSVKENPNSSFHNNPSLIF